MIEVVWPKWQTIVSHACSTRRNTVVHETVLREAQTSCRSVEQTSCINRVIFACARGQDWAKDTKALGIMPEFGVDPVVERRSMLAEIFSLAIWSPRRYAAMKARASLCRADQGAG